MVNYVIVGGGVAGVYCAEELCTLCPEDTCVSTVAKITQTIEEIKLIEKDFSEIAFKNFTWIQGYVTSINTQTNSLLLSDGTSIQYDKLCICTGAQPKRVLNSPYVEVIRDSDSIESLSLKLDKAKNIVVVGNGGIALELAYVLRNVDITWIVRHNHIGDAFFDIDASNFLLDELLHKRASHINDNNDNDGGTETHNNSTDTNKESKNINKESKNKLLMGHAVGPQWTSTLRTKTPSTKRKEEKISPPLSHPSSTSRECNLHIEYQNEIIDIQPIVSTTNSTHESHNDGSCSPLENKQQQQQQRYSITLSDNRKINTDLVISAIGVDPGPSLSFLPPTLLRDQSSHALLVNNHMQTSIPNIYAAGDACCARWAEETSPHWFQMRLWSQARSMGIYAAHCMSGVNDDRGADMSFEVFTHATRFLGKKVVLIGLYNGQKLEHENEDDMKSYSRILEDDEEYRGGCCGGGHTNTGGGSFQFATAGKGRQNKESKNRTFVRVVLLKGKVQGAVMIGETGLEETMENLILDGIDVSRYGAELLDPDAEIEHIFD